VCDSFYNDDLERWDNWERKNAKAFEKDDLERWSCASPLFFRVVGSLSMSLLCVDSSKSIMCASFKKCS
jgi:hypothetical protein